MKIKQFLFYMLEKDGEDIKSLAKVFLYFLFVCAVTIAASQIAIEVGAFEMGFGRFLWGVTLLLPVALILYFLSSRRTFSATMTTLPVMLLSSVNYYVYSFRERMVELGDVMSVSTALKVISNYSFFPLPKCLYLSWTIYIFSLLAASFLVKLNKTEINNVQKRYTFYLVLLLGFPLVIKVNTLTPFHWQKMGASKNGFVLNLAASIKETVPGKPKGYSVSKVDELAITCGSSLVSTSNEEELPSIIVILDESFADLSVVADFRTNKEVTPFVNSLYEDTVKGKALVSVYGGNTANTEYEFLTGNTMGFLYSSSVPFQQYIKEPTYSMASYLKNNYSYKTIAVHPYFASSWNRPEAYKNLGFDEMHFIDDFPQQDYVRNYISDKEMFDYIINTFEENRENPFFLYGVTMQNHGGYKYEGNDFVNEIQLRDFGEELDEVEQYLTLTNITDKAVEYLLDYFKNVDKKVIICFYGDHLPTFTNYFYDEIDGKTNGNLDKYQKRHKVPFFIWANYDIEEKQVDCTSMSYLSAYVYDVAGIENPAYNVFLKELEKHIPSINASGFYSINSGKYRSFNKANDEEEDWLKLYKYLQYNNLFDKSNRNETLFPS